MKKVPVVLLPFTILILVSCQKEEEPVTYPPRAVVVQRLAEPVGAEIRTFSGVIEASGGTTLGFEVAGRITQMVAQEGGAYREGDVLAQLDVSNLEAELRRAEAESERANEELKRVQQLFESDNASRAQFDSAIAAQRSATANLTVARKSVADGTLKMPYDGVIEDVIADAQNVVAAGAPVLSIQGDGAMEMKIGVPAETLSSLEVDMAVTVRVGRIEEDGIPAKIRKISPQASANATYEVTLLLENAGPDIRGGMDAEADITFANPEGLTLRVDSAAVVSSPDASPFVWVWSETSDGEGQVHKRPVRIGELRENGEIEILEGTKAGELVVIRGAHRLSEGTVATVLEKE